MALELISGVYGVTTGGSTVAAGLAPKDRGTDNPIWLSIGERRASMSSREARVLAKALNALADKIDDEEVPF